MSLLPSRPDAEPAEDAGPRVIGVDDDAADDVLSALASGTARSVLAALHDEPAPPSELAGRVDTSLQNVQYHLAKLEGAGAVEVVDTAYSAKGREMDVYAPADQPLVVFAGDADDGSTLRTALSRLLGAVGVLALGSLLVEVIYGNLSIDLGVGLGGSGDGDRGGGDAGDGGSGGADGTSGGDGDAAPQDGPAVETEASPPGDGGAPTGGGGGGADAADAPTTVTPEATETPTELARDTATEVATTAADGGAAADAVASGIPPGLLFFAGGLFVIAVIAAIWYVGQR